MWSEDTRLRGKKALGEQGWRPSSTTKQKSDPGNHNSIAISSSFQWGQSARPQEVKEPSAPINVLIRSETKSTVVVVVKTQLVNYLETMTTTMFVFPRGQSIIFLHLGIFLNKCYSVLKGRKVSYFYLFSSSWF